MFPGNLDKLLESKHCFKALKFVIVLLVYECRYGFCAFSQVLFCVCVCVCEVSYLKLLICLHLQLDEIQ